MYKRQWIAAGLLAGIAAATVWACGPDFPSQLLDHRELTLKATPQNSFAFEAASLLPATDKLPDDDSGEAPKADDAAAMAKWLGLAPAQWQQLAELRQLQSGAEVYEKGKGLPEDLRLYAAGAADFEIAQGACEGHGAASEDASAAGEDAAPAPAHCMVSSGPGMDQAVASFEKVLALPPEQAKLRSVWAAYMLGRIHAERALDQAGDAAAFKREREAAAKAFQQARARALDGGSDTQGLALSSFGEEARLHLFVDGKRCGWNEIAGPDNDCGVRLAPDDMKHAITLYAAQAGHGSGSAVQSLSILANTALRDDTLAAALIDHPLSQRLLVIYALARVDDVVSEAADGKSMTTKPNPNLVALVAAIEQRGLEHVEGADRLAALAYRAGRYDLAAKLVDKAPGPLSSWVRAKLALQKGDLAAATAAYAEAVKAFPKANDPKASIDPDNSHLLVGEQGVLALARGEYVEAMGRLYDAAIAVGGSGNVFYPDDETSGIGFGNDVTYLAERVLTIDELKSFVDARVPASAPPAPAKAGSAVPSYYPGSAPFGDNLRWTLARRLMRAGRYDEAQNYLPASGDERFGKDDLRAKAREFARDLHDAEHAWTDIGKAEARYRAAAIQRELGMELFGYEQGPDYNDMGGGFQGGSGHGADDLKQSFVTDGERQRYADTVPKPDRRFHYRYLAADRAAAAADLLPPRSQAFAAVLCKASGWMLDGPPDYGDNGDGTPPVVPERLLKAKALYDRYVKQGPYVPWAENFGESCPEPDFASARVMQRHLYVVKAKRALRHNVPLLAGGLVLVIGIVSFAVVRRRKKAARTA
ncbi:hypothetical protein KK141_16205 [Dyella sp. LX-66]|uniref:hypothetical protein n=1 Tax=unclassified Dyella TaxID=2634549 RepID=UPI001BE0910C|nr:MULTISPECIES: hypothetical protein [unclassified Dyella]MBT2118742.1 hypothetical protein [Dyella sp. LX-1]MBT2141091.1 hypothetical protein [Dyella sp. LX-66]